LKSGVKPKKKSNTVSAVLLFLFAFHYASASWPPSDTIIIDGESIYIEKEYLLTDIDSLQAEAKKDVVKKPLNTRPFTIGFHCGPNLTTAKFSSALPDLVPLNDFASDKVSSKFNLFAALDLSARFWTFPAMKGLVELSIHSGLAWNQIKIQCDAFDENEWNSYDRRFVKYVDDELFLEHFVTYGDSGSGIGELDTAYIKILRNITHFPVLDVPLKIHADYRPNKSKWSYFLETGIVNRFILSSSGEAYDNFMLNQKADYLMIPSKDFKVKNLIQPAFGVGCERKLESKSEKGGAYWSIGSQFNAILPATNFNSNAVFLVDVKSFNLSIFVRIHV
jgi:hypothetical protein